MEFKTPAQPFKFLKDVMVFYQHINRLNAELKRLMDEMDECLSLELWTKNFVDALPLQQELVGRFGMNPRKHHSVTRNCNDIHNG
jgi:hypothetical protein